MDEEEDSLGEEGLGAERRPSTAASTALFLAVAALVSSYAIVGGLLAVPALYFARRAMRDFGGLVRFRKANRTMAVAAVWVSLLALVFAVVAGVYWFVYLPGHRGHHGVGASSQARPAATQ